MRDPRHSPQGAIVSANIGDDDRQATREEVRQSAAIAWFSTLLAFIVMLFCSFGHAASIAPSFAAALPPASTYEIFRSASNKSERTNATWICAHHLRATSFETAQ